MAVVGDGVMNILAVAPPFPEDAENSALPKFNVFAVVVIVDPVICITAVPPPPPAISPVPVSSAKSLAYTVPLIYAPCDADIKRGVIIAPDIDAMLPLMKCVELVSICIDDENNVGFVVTLTY